MDPFTQRMLERARARQEKIDQKLANSGQVVPIRKPLSENISVMKSETSPVKSPSKISRDSIISPKKTLRESPKSESPAKISNRRSSSQKFTDKVVPSPLRPRNDIVVTKKEFSPRKGGVNRRNSDVSVEINICHHSDIQLDIQVEERDAPINIIYDNQACIDNNVVIQEIGEDTSSKMENAVDSQEQSNDKGILRHNMKSRLDRLGNLYSDAPNLSSPIHRTESEFTSATPPPKGTPRPPRPLPDGKRKYGRLAALADQINNWEDDLTHHSHNPEPVKKSAHPLRKKEQKHEESTLDVSIHSINDINKAMQSSSKKQESKPVNSRTFSKPASNEHQRLGKQIVAELEPSAPTTPSALPAPDMAATVVTPPAPAIAKKPSLKKYKAPTPPSKPVTDDECESDKDKENVRDDAPHCIQTKPDEKPAPAGSPHVKSFAQKLNGNADRSSVLSKAAMFEAGSPKSKDPAEMSLRERKALFEKNKGTAIIPKAPFGLAPSVKTLHGDKAETRSARPVTVLKPSPSKSDSRTHSKESIPDDNVSQTSIGGGIKGKLAALFSKEQTISESTIANKFKQEREREMEMLQNRFHKTAHTSHDRADKNHESDDNHSDDDTSENEPLMRSNINLASKKPEIISNIPKVTLEKTTSEIALVERDEDKVQPVKRRSSQDSPAVLSVLDDVKRIKVNNTKNNDLNGVVFVQPSIYPHLSDIETDTSNTQEEYSDCGGSSAEDMPKSCLKSNDALNKSDNWAETSFGREVMNVVKKNSSYQKAVRESYSSESSREAGDSELDDMLDEALHDSEGPTPPKLNKTSGLSSTSFVYQDKSENAREQFKSPLKAQAPTTPASSRDKGSELVHSVSFYRRMQSASSTPSTPLRVVRHSSPARETPSGPEPAAATTVRQRTKELQNEISKQQSVISQASQALNLCAATIEFSGSKEQAEAERLLLLATHRRQACVHELQRLQVEGAGIAATEGMASLHIQGLSVPLRRDYVRQLNADGAVGHHAVCLLKCRDRVLATSMQLTLPTTALLHFPDDVHMLGLASDFKVTVEVYLLQACKENLPHDVKYHISSKKTSKLLTPKSRAGELKTPKIQSPGGPLAVRSPQFQLHGYCIFALPQAARKTFTLNKVPCGSPLEGSVNMAISARLRVPAPAPHAAFLTAFDDVSGLGAWHRRWFRLQAPRLQYWKYPDDVQKKLPIGDIDLAAVTSDKAVRAPRDLCARPNTILLETSVPDGLIVPDCGSLVYVRRPDGVLVRRHLLAADTPRDRDVWLDALNAALEFVRCSPCDSD